MGRVVVVGSLNIDLVTHVERFPQPGETLLGQGLERLAGGKGANQAVAAREAGAEVVMVGAVGDDDAGRSYAARLRGLGIDTRLEIVAGPSGHAMITVDEAGENVIIVVPGANAQLGESALSALDELAAGDVVLVQLEIPLTTAAIAVRRACARGARVVINCSPYAGLPPDVLALADPVVVNESEAALLADGELVATSLLVTFGAAGAMWDGERVDGVAVAAGDVLDTTGAGDAFCGALAAALAAGADRSGALHLAAGAGARAVRRVGAQPDPAL
ncbi:ribokinase [Lapillicoccus sp.]|uniref:ribokinase n=1 Tax=Lapillicoccus sp. TaxID=1909287 RepID=UPI003982EB53